MAARSEMFPRMSRIVRPGAVGIAEVEHFEVNEFASRMSAIRGGSEWVEEGTYAKLKVNGRLYMSDTRYEKITNSEAVRMSSGDVLIAGLGLGMILHPILAKATVRSIHVIEKFQDVITLISPTVANRKLTIECADIYEWKPARGVKFDTIYFDIWADMSTDDLEDMAKVHQRGKTWKRPGAWMQSWNRDVLKAQKAQDARRWP